MNLAHDGSESSEGRLTFSSVLRTSIPVQQFGDAPQYLLMYLGAPSQAQRSETMTLAGNSLDTGQAGGARECKNIMGPFQCSSSPVNY
jgi:hypothetical protein